MTGLRCGILLALLTLPGWGLAQQGVLTSFTSTIPIAQLVNFPSLPIAIEAEGMGNAGVADGSLMNNSAMNPALLANKADFAEIRLLGINVGNDPLGMADYLTGSNNLTNLQNSLQNVSSSFQDISNGLSGSGGVNANEYNAGVAGVNNAVTNLQSAVSHMTNKVIQLGVEPFNFAFKFDDHWGFQFYNNTQMVVAISSQGLAKQLLQMSLLQPLNVSGSNPVTGSTAQIAVTTFYNTAQPILNSYLNSSQQAQLQTAVSVFGSSDGGPTAVQNLATTVTAIMNSVDPSAANKTLFNNISPITSLFYTDTVAMATYCTRPLEDDPAFSLGVNLKFVNRRITSVSSSFLINQNTTDTSNIGDDVKNDLEQTNMVYRWGVDLGLLYDFDDPQVSVGVAATDLLHSSGVLNTNPGDPLNQNGGPVTIDPAPTVIRTGVCWRVNRDLTLDADVNDLFNSTSYYVGLGFLDHVDFGFNYNLWGILQLRGGVTNGNLCGGLGLPLGIQYAFAVDNLSQSYNHYLQLINMAF